MFMFSDNAFKMVFERQSEQPLAVRLDVIAVQEPFALPGHHRPKASFAVDER